MDIILYLTELIQTRKTVGIAGLGTLYKKKSPGKYDPVKHEFIPPSYQLAFTNEVKEEFELVNYVVNKRNLTEDSAKFFINDFVERIKSQLSEHQEADLEPLGKLKIVNGEITFFNDQESSFGYEFYGMPSVADIHPTAADADKLDNAETESTLLEEIEEENKLEEENPGQEAIEEPVTGDLDEDNFNEEDVYDEINEVESIQHTPEAVIENQPNIEEVESEPLTTEDQPVRDASVETIKWENPIEHIPAEQNGVEPAPATEKPPVIETAENSSQLEEEYTLAEEKAYTPEKGPIFLDNKMRNTVAVEKTFNVNQELEYDHEEAPKKGISTFVKFLIVLLLIAILGAIIYFVNPSFFDKYIQKNHEGKPRQSVPVVVNDSLNKKTDTLVTAQPNLPVAKDSSVVDTTEKYYEVIGSTENNQQSADAYIARVAKLGIVAKSVHLSKRKVSVSIGTFSDQKQALKYTDSLRKLLKNNGIYAQPMKPKKHTN